METNLHKITILIEKKQILYLKSIGIGRSKFMRQAISAHKKGQFIYKYIDEDDIEKYEDDI